MGKRHVNVPGWAYPVAAVAALIAAWTLIGSERSLFQDIILFTVLGMSLAVLMGGLFNLGGKGEGDEGPDQGGRNGFRGNWGPPGSGPR